MPNEVTLYHNPRCSKSRQALKLLQEKGVEPKIIEYLKDRPATATIKKLIELLENDPNSAVRTKESAYEEAGLSEDSTNADVIAAIAESPGLLERPIAVRGDRAIIGRPPERVLELLDA